MKTLKSIFENKRSKKSIDTFTKTLEVKHMFQIRGGEGDEEEGGDTWPPTGTDKNTSN